MSEQGQVGEPLTHLRILKEKSPEVARDLEQGTTSVTRGLSAALLEMQPDRQMVLLESVRAFGDSVYVRAASENLKDPDRLQTALDGAAALLSPKPLDKNGAQKMVDALKDRYGL